MADFVATLRRRYGDRVVDLFAGTGIEQAAERLTMGCYVVRGVLTWQQQLQWHQYLSNSMTCIAEEKGPHVVELKGKSKK